MTDFDRDRLRAQLVRHEAMKLSIESGLREQLSKERRDALYLVGGCVALDHVGSIADHDHVARNIPPGRDDSVDSRAVTTHRPLVDFQRDSEHWTPIRHWNVSPVDRAWHVISARAPPALLHQTLAVQNLVAVSGCLLQALFVATLRLSNTRLVLVVRRSVLSIGAVAAFAIVSTRAGEKQVERFCRFASTAIAPIGTNVRGRHA